MGILGHPFVRWVIATALFVSLPLIQHLNGGLLAVGIQPASELLNNEKKRGMLLASSGLHCALNKKELTLEPSYYLPGASVLDDLKGIENILAYARPDYIVLHSAALTNRLDTTPLKYWVRHTKHYWLETLSNIHPIVRDFFVRIQCTFSISDKKYWLDKLTRNVDIRETLSNSSRTQQSLFLQKLANHDIPLFIVNQPYPNLGQIYSTALNESIEQLIQPLTKRENIHILKYTEKHPDTMFYDPYHVKPELSDIFTDWFAFQISQVTNK